jgi:hypothetical protein
MRERSHATNRFFVNLTDKFGLFFGFVHSGISRGINDKIRLLPLKNNINLIRVRKVADGSVNKKWLSILLGVSQGLRELTGRTKTRIVMMLEVKPRASACLDIARSIIDI